MNKATLLNLVQTQLGGLLALYAFGSRIRGTATASSDLDLAVLVAGYADPVLLFDLAGKLADITGCAVDLVDLRAASTVMQYQIITTGERWWQKDAQAALFEAAVLSEKTALDTARAALIEDIQHRGSIYG
ncbi:type VII toxin-antitoxin system MntA family adenylyltransferase antitoxin [Methylomonas methanica]|uniref:DNA polymerase subunit beta n=1 Tax=Methylomonas methanica TaxID=421 RepID=A0A177M2Z2_METMH|nr:nucleotidyltransferase domain-containing protein [Methylomonas methanica]OAH99913.1 DNA polymerase subunit beta [Methylomonas methanica]